jgi:hypothetical protein
MKKNDGRGNRKSVLKQCVHCDKDFIGKTTAKYCSTLCRIFSRIKKCETGCWEWQAYCLNGYGRLKIGPKETHLVHRKVFTEINKVQLDVKELVCHKCDNRKCVNPDHLFLGTHKDNFLDCIKKKRRIFATGEESANHKLNWMMVDEIRKLRQEGWTIVKLGEKYGVNHSNISNICLHKTWRTS